MYNIFQLLSVTEKAAYTASKWVGKGDEKSADQAAVDSMRSSLNNLPYSGYIAIGEGERDMAPMLFTGESIGHNTIDKFCFAVDPLEGTAVCAEGRDGAMSVLAIAENAGLLNAPDIYMEKIIVGADLSKCDLSLNLDLPLKYNLGVISEASRKNIADLNIIVLKRARHFKMIEEIREHGARVTLIDDGDIAAAITVCSSQNIDAYMGTGGSPEGVLAAVALQGLSGTICARLILDDSVLKKRAINMGITDLNKQYSANDLAPGKNMLFIATGITNGSILQGVHQTQGRNGQMAEFNSLIIESHMKTITNVTRSMPIINDVIY